MNAALDALSERLDEVRARITRAAARSGRKSGSVVLVAAVKQLPVETVLGTVALGVPDLGESRVQEAQLHRASLVGAPVRWHLIGHLQRNKASRAVDMFDRIQSIDDVELAGTLSRLAVERGRTLPVLIEVDVVGESSKFGASPDDVPRLADEVAALPGLALDGLMMVGPAGADPERARPGFARLREIRDAAERALGRTLPQLSMGMSGDYEVAIEEGATMVRIGTALYGPRI